MIPARRPLVVISGSVVLLASIAACGGPAAPVPAAAPTSATAQSATATPAPATNAPETNPAGDIPDNQVYVPFRAPDGSFTVSVPEGWSRVTDGTATTFTDKLNSVRIEDFPVAQPPDVASAKATEVPKLASSVPGYRPGGVGLVQRTAGPAVLITYQANSAPNPVTGRTVADAVERYEFAKGGREVVLTLSGPQGADNVDPWRMVTDSFRWAA